MKYKFLGFVNPFPLDNADRFDVCPPWKRKLTDYAAVMRYQRFMYNPANIECCDRCPENREFDSPLPCGQMQCWVHIHCKEGM